MRFRKKPVVIEAIQIPFPDDGTMPGWIALDIDIILKRDNGLIIEAIINTLEGTMIASKGDWIIKGVKGELYLCESDIFAATYEVAI